MSLMPFDNSLFPTQFIENRIQDPIWQNQNWNNHFKWMDGWLTPKVSNYLKDIHYFIILCTFNTYLRFETKKLIYFKILKKFN